MFCLCGRYEQAAADPGSRAQAEAATQPRYSELEGRWEQILSCPPAAERPRMVTGAGPGFNGPASAGAGAACSGVLRWLFKRANEPREEARLCGCTVASVHLRVSFLLR